MLFFIPRCVSVGKLCAGHECLLFFFFAFYEFNDIDITLKPLTGVLILLFWIL